MALNNGCIQLFFIILVRKTTSLQVVAIWTNLLFFDILLDNFQ